MLHERVDNDDWFDDEDEASDVSSAAEISEIMQLDIADESANSGKAEYLTKCALAQPLDRKHPTVLHQYFHTVCRLSAQM